MNKPSVNYCLPLPTRLKAVKLERFFKTAFQNSEMQSKFQSSISEIYQSSTTFS